MGIKNFLNDLRGVAGDHPDSAPRPAKDRPTRNRNDNIAEQVTRELTDPAAVKYDPDTAPRGIVRKTYSVFYASKAPGMDRWYLNTDEYLKALKKRYAETGVNDLERRVAQELRDGTLYEVLCRCDVHGDRLYPFADAISDMQEAFKKDIAAQQAKIDEQKLQDEAAQARENAQRLSADAPAILTLWQNMSPEERMNFIRSGRMDMAAAGVLWSHMSTDEKNAFMSPIAPPADPVSAAVPEAPAPGPEAPAPEAPATPAAPPAGVPAAPAPTGAPGAPAGTPAPVA